LKLPKELPNSWDCRPQSSHSIGSFGSYRSRDENGYKVV
jgi:hypothetical protein